MANFRHSLQSKKMPSMVVMSVHLSVTQYHNLNCSTDIFKTDNTVFLRPLQDCLLCIINNYSYLINILDVRLINCK